MIGEKHLFDLLLFNVYHLYWMIITSSVNSRWSSPFNRTNSAATMNIIMCADISYTSFHPLQRPSLDLVLRVVFQALPVKFPNQDGFVRCVLSWYKRWAYKLIIDWVSWETVETIINVPIFFILTLSQLVEMVLLPYWGHLGDPELGIRTTTHCNKELFIQRIIL